MLTVNIFISFILISNIICDENILSIESNYNFPYVYIDNNTKEINGIDIQLINLINQKLSKKFDLQTFADDHRIQNHSQK